ncbi:hypothetical protein BDW02DRAFT_642871 [Decorospora gaudefroyi]|uniref:Uncharacterized protein n=1 Tax=Decorospora gaudefroyi TaxID=184978 RepID=A0A6A5JYX4_9PLEO|nr:hypothetical protein BDW02DRAFT_642871 [Decorospora gaudefroyi]
MTSMSVFLTTLASTWHTLLPTTALLRPPQTPQNPSLTAKIANLHVHPTLETLLHILNHDLPSAHFLVRHMQAPPAVEGMLLHSILHRAEGDFRNARLWAGDVVDACEGFVPKHRGEGRRLGEEVLGKIEAGKGMDAVSLVEYVYGEEGPGGLIDAVEKWRKDGEGEEREIEERIRKECERLLEWCRSKFGEGEWLDASEAWVRHSDEVREISGEMVTGGKGFRKF